MSSSWGCFSFFLSFSFSAVVVAVVAVVVVMWLLCVCCVVVCAVRWFVNRPTLPSSSSSSSSSVQLQRLVTTGALPCSKEEAASLAAIQLRLQECSPTATNTTSKPAATTSSSVSAKSANVHNSPQLVAPSSSPFAQQQQVRDQHQCLHFFLLI